MGTVIITDSGSDFTRAEGERLGVEIVPIWITFGDKRYKDGIDIDRETFFKRMKAGEIPKTEPASAAEYRDVFARLVGAGNDVVMISLSSAISESLAHASEGAKEFGDKVSIIDSKAASGLETLLTLYALELAKSGASAAEIAKRADPRGMKYAVLFAVPDLTQLGRSGRLPKAVVALGSMLNVSLVLKINESGAVAPAGQSFSFDKTCDLMVESLVRAIDRAPNARIAFDHVQAASTVETMRASLEKKLGHPPKQELIYETSLTLAAHLGIGAVGISAIVPP